MKNGFSKALRAVIQRTTGTAIGLSRKLKVPNNTLSTWLRSSHHPRSAVMGKVLRILPFTPKERVSALADFFGVKDLADLSIIVPDEDLERSHEVAQQFHEVYEELAPKHGYETREDSRVPWEDVPAQNRDLMVEVARTLLERGVIVVPAP